MNEGIAAGTVNNSNYVNLAAMMVRTLLRTKRPLKLSDSNIGFDGRPFLVSTWSPHFDRSVLLQVLERAVTCHERYLSDAQRDPAAMRRWQQLLDDFYLPQQVRPPRAPSSVSRYSVSRNTHTPICQDRLGTTDESMRGKNGGACSLRGTWCCRSMGRMLTTVPSTAGQSV